MCNKQEKQTSKQVFWQYISTDDEGITIKVYNKAKQQELQELVERADKKLAKELEVKKKMIEAVTLEEAEEFDNLVAELVNTDAIYVKAGKMTGRNLQIDWDKVDKKNSTGTKQGTKQKKQLEIIKVDATFEF